MALKEQILLVLACWLLFQACLIWLFNWIDNIPKRELEKRFKTYFKDAKQ